MKDAEVVLKYIWLKDLTSLVADIQGFSNDFAHYIGSRT